MFICEASLSRFGKEIRMKKYEAPVFELVRANRATFLAVSGEMEGEVWRGDCFNDDFGTKFGTKF